METPNSGVVTEQGGGLVNPSPAQDCFDAWRALGECVTAWNGNGTPAPCQTQQLASPLSAGTCGGWQPKQGELHLDE
ncbi:MAG: hypothetical protein RI935_394 [Candidatus Parcubacteria bacterium]|jgi:hypothetical protein